MSSSMQTALGGYARSVSDALSHAFPTPSYLLPPSAGVDISDASIKWLVLERASYGRGLRVALFGEEPLAPGIVENGVIKDPAALAEALRKMRENLGGIACAHAALPEEPAYIFEMRVPKGTPRDQVMKLIEFEFEGRVPISPDISVFDYDSIEYDEKDMQIGVSVFPRDLAKSYADVFATAGMTLLSLEIESRSIARTICDNGDPLITLLVDFGRARSGFAVLKNGIPIFSSTVEVGGNAIDKALQEKLGLSVAQATHLKNEEGLYPEDGNKTPGMEMMVATASALGDEVARHFHYWDTRRNDRGDRMTPVSRVVLVGGSSNLSGLTDYIAGRVQAPTYRGDVWRRVCDYNEYIPPIDRRTSLQYATAIGLALRAFI